MKPSFIDKDQFREDLEALLKKDDVDILLALFEARHCQNPRAEVAKHLGLTEGRVQHRTLKTIDQLRRIAGYAVVLQRAIEGDDAKLPSN